ncbi:hypothetical protein V8F20_001430 [Naviculisporaceae sp. PSN 640]
MSDKTKTKHRWWSSSSSKSVSSTSSSTAAMPDQANSTNKEKEDAPKKKSLYQRYQDAKRGRNTTISDEELLKYTGKTKSQIVEWGDRTPGVAGNQLAGRADVGPTSGLGGVAMAEGYGGWGTEGDNGGPSRGLKFAHATVAAMNGPRTGAAGEGSRVDAGGEAKVKTPGAVEEGETGRRSEDGKKGPFKGDDGRE